MSWNPEREMDILAQAYRSGTLEILKRVETMAASGRSTQHARAALAEVTSILRELDEFADEWIEQNIPLAYRQGWEQAFQTGEYRVPDHLGDRLPYSAFAKVHRQAVEIVAYSLRDSLHGATKTVGRQAQDVYRRIGLERTQLRLLTGESLAETTAAMKEQFLKQGVTAFQDRVGRTWSLDSYCEMVARTTTREATVNGTVNRAAAGGYDLVIVSEHHPTCGRCAPLGGKVFNLTGNTLGYPRWEGYVPVHPNCRHTVSVYQPQFDSEAEWRKEHSNTSLARDPRSEAEKRTYDATQEKKRQQRDLREQYRRYRARLGDQAGTIQNFARAKKADGQKWANLQTQYRAAGREELAYPLRDARMDLKAFGEDPESRITRLVRDGAMPQEAVDRALEWWRGGHQVLMLPNGEQLLVSRDDLLHVIVDKQIWSKPERIRRAVEGVYELRTSQKAANYTIGLSTWSEEGNKRVGYVVIDPSNHLRSLHVVNDKRLKRYQRQGDLLWKQ